jgi:hypothetical protein
MATVRVTKVLADDMKYGLSFNIPRSNEGRPMPIATVQAVRLLTGHHSNFLTLTPVSLPDAKKLVEGAIQLNASIPVFRWMKRSSCATICEIATSRHALISGTPLM